MVKTVARVPLWDNAKYLIMVTVVAGHAIEQLRLKGTIAFGLYSLFYLFHMPVMIFISGYFSRKEVSRKTIQSLAQLLAIYVIWECLTAAFKGVFFGETLPKDFLISPSSGMWYLMALILMRLLLPYIVATRWPLTVSLMIAFGSTLFSQIDDVFASARAFQFLPFFIAGYLAKEKGWLNKQWFLRPPAWAVAVSAALVTAVGCVMLVLPRIYDDWKIFGWFMLRDSMEEILDPADLTFPPFFVALEATDSDNALLLVGLLLKAVFMIAAAVVGLAFLLMVPRNEAWFTRLGKNSLNIYVVHLLLIYAARELDLIVPFYLDNGLLGLAIILLCSLAIATLLGTDVVAKALRPLTAPNVNWVFEARGTVPRPSTKPTESERASAV